MKRNVLMRDGRGEFCVVEQEISGPGQDELLIETKATLVSPGTELGRIKKMREKPGEDSAPPEPFGYQAAGVVIEKGANCGAFRAGQRVAFMGGGYAQHATHNKAPKNLVFPIPDSLSFEAAAFNHLAATALQAIRRAELTIGEYVAIAGMGLVGQLACQLAVVSGCGVGAFDVIAERLQIAKSLGADIVLNPRGMDAPSEIKKFTKGWGLDAAVIAFGGDATPAFKMLIEMMKHTPDKHAVGRIVIVGGCFFSTTWASSTGNVDVRSSARTGPGYHDKEWEKGKDYPPVFVQWDTRRNVNLCIDLMMKGRLKTAELVTHRVSLEQAPGACDELIYNPDKALGVIILP